MADFDKIKINGVPYNVKDTATAQAVEQQGQTISQQGQTIAQQGQTIAQQGQTIAQQGEQIANLVTNTPGFNLYKTGAVLIIGDSFAGTWQGFQNGSWAERFIKKIGNPNHYIYSYGGCGFTAGDNANHLNYAQNIAQNIAPALADVADTVTLVVIQGGVNDYEQDFATEKTNTLQAIENVRSYFKNAKIIGLTNLSLFKCYRTTMLAINEAFDMAGVPNTVYGNYYTLAAENLFAEDKLHPNDAGHSYIAALCYKLLLGSPMTPNRNGFFLKTTGGGLICQIFGDKLEIYGYDTVRGTEQTPYVATMNSYLAPSTYTAIPIYADSGLAYMVFNTDGKIQYHSPQAIPSGFGTLRFNITLLLDDK